MTRASGRTAIEPDEARWLVPLPPDAEPPLEVFVSGVPQQHGQDYEIERRGGRPVLAFSRPLQKEGKLGFWRWALMFLSIAGSYGRDDSVDVRYAAGGHGRVATGLEIVPPRTSPAGGPGREPAPPARR